MAGPTITITNPPEGTGPNNPVNFGGASITATGTVTPSAGKISTMSYTVDDNEPIGFHAPPQTGAPPFVWGFSLPGGFCIPMNSWHTLTVYAWDSNGAGLTSRSFYRGS
jgi:hypothetical protein